MHALNLASTYLEDRSSSSGRKDGEARRCREDGLEAGRCVGSSAALRCNLLMAETLKKSSAFSTLESQGPRR